MAKVDKFSKRKTSKAIDDEIVLNRLMQTLV